jgi:hypothetical protein
VPRIVAEALAPVPDPVVTAIRPGEWRTGPEVARAMARLLAPDEAREAGEIATGRRWIDWIVVTFLAIALSVHYPKPNK